MCVLLPLAPLLKMQYAYQVTHPHGSLAPAGLLNSLTNFHRAFLQSLIITVLKHCWEGTGAVEMAVFTQRYQRAPRLRFSRAVSDLISKK